MEQSSTLEAALSYLSYGWSVIPAAELGKRPIVRWRAYQDDLPTEKQLYKWFSRWPKANLFVVTGAISNIVVLDVDPKHGGKESLKKLEARHGILPETVESLTGGGGRQKRLRWHLCLSGLLSHALAQTVKLAMG